jgi:hypothetical protein
MQDTFDEMHFSLKEFAQRYKMSEDTARRLVKDEPGVVKIKIGRKQARTLYSIPESVARRIYNRFVGGCAGFGSNGKQYNSGNSFYSGNGAALNQQLTHSKALSSVRIPPPPP